MLLGATPEFGRPGPMKLELFKIPVTFGGPAPPPLPAGTPNVVNRNVIVPPVFAVTITLA